MDRESMSAVMTGLAWPRRFAVLPALRVFARDVGPLGIGGIVLLATAALAWPLLVTAPQRSAQELRRDSARLRVRQAAPSAPPAVLLPALQIERFGAHFPPAVRLPASLSGARIVAQGSWVRTIIAVGPTHLQRVVQRAAALLTAAVTTEGKL